MNVLKHTIKKFIYGTLPYYFMKGYKPGSPYLKYYEYIKEHARIFFDPEIVEDFFQSICI